jgi:hypothetical protein
MAGKICNLTTFTSCITGLSEHHVKVLLDCNASGSAVKHTPKCHFSNYKMSFNQFSFWLIFLSPFIPSLNDYGFCLSGFCSKCGPWSSRFISIICSSLEIQSFMSTPQRPTESKSVF